jgi:tetratricopeptide (TPR) repeat protein
MFVAEGQMTDYRVFISGASSEVGKARSEIASDLRGSRGFFVRVQEDFRQERDAETTLAKLEKYIRSCDAVVHIAGKRSGAFPGEREAEPFRHMLPDGVTRASYTQWEYYIAQYYRRHLTRYVANDDYVADRPEPSSTDDDAALQAAHVARVEQFDRSYFSNTDKLCRLVLKEEWPERKASPPQKPRNLPFASLGDLFKGREKDFDALHRLLNDPSAKATAVTGRALHGVGGVGKTRLAVEYAHQHANEHSALIFLSAETPERLEAGLAALAGPDMFDLAEKDAREDKVKIPAALGWLERNPGWLMILDNVDDEAALRAAQTLLGKLSGGKVIITGRLTAYPAAVKKLELGVLPLDAAAAFLLERTASDRMAAPDDEAESRELTKELGGLALGLEQAGAYISAERTSFANYLKLWQENREKVISWFDRDLMSYGHDSGLAATWATSVERLTPEARQLLERLAFLAPEPIPDTLLEAKVAEQAEGFDAHAARRQLFTYSLATRVAGEAAATPSFSIHRLVQDFAMRDLDAAGRRAALQQTLNWVAAAFVGNPGDVRTWALLDPLAPHALVVAERGYTEGIAVPTAVLCSRLARLFHAKARYGDAERESRRALAINETSVGPDHPNVAACLNNLAELLREMNRPAEAEPLLRRALSIGEVSLGPDHPGVAAGLGNLAGLLMATNRVAEAEPLYRRALAIDEATYGAGHPEVATDLNNLAALLRATNREAEAEPLCRRALAIDEATYGMDHPEVAADLDNLADLLRDTSRTAEAEPLIRRALAIDEANLGPNHPKVATRLNNLASLLLETGRTTEAEPLLRRAVAIDEASLGPNHPNVAVRLSNLAKVLRNRNQPADAEQLYRRALAIDEAGRGPSHPNIAVRLVNLAKLLSDEHRDAEAEPPYRRALAICEASLGPDDPRTERVRANLSALGGE